MVACAVFPESDVLLGRYGVLRKRALFVFSYLAGFSQFSHSEVRVNLPRTVYSILAMALDTSAKR